MSSPPANRPRVDLPDVTAVRTVEFFHQVFLGRLNCAARLAPGARRTLDVWIDIRIRSTGRRRGKRRIESIGLASCIFNRFVELPRVALRGREIIAEVFYPFYTGGISFSV